MNIHKLIGAVVVAAVLLFVTGCGSSPSHSSSTGCSSGQSNSACATVQVRAN